MKKSKATQPNSNLDNQLFPCRNPPQKASIYKPHLNSFSTLFEGILRVLRAFTRLSGFSQKYLFLLETAFEGKSAHAKINICQIFSSNKEKYSGNLALLSIDKNSPDHTNGNILHVKVCPIS